MFISSYAIYSEESLPKRARSHFYIIATVLYGIVNCISIRFIATAVKPSSWVIYISCS